MQRWKHDNSMWLFLRILFWFFEFFFNCIGAGDCKEGLVMRLPYAELSSNSNVCCEKWFCDLRTKITGLSNYMIGISRRGRWSRDYLLFMQAATILISSTTGRKVWPLYVSLGHAELGKTCHTDYMWILPFQCTTWRGTSILIEQYFEKNVLMIA